jgi:formylglycine-generating enzyme required for sulfatase activity/RES domain-containing protein
VSEVISIWRIASQGRTWRANDLSGNGAALNPGRWNSLDRPIVYSSSSIALACLETVVHLAGDDSLPFPRQLVRITIPSPHWQQRKIFANEGFSGWSSAPTPEHEDEWLAATRAWGDAWLLGLDSLLAEVPSVIVPEETNLLLNPRHPAHGEMVAEIVRPWVYDARLLPNARTSTARAGTPQAGPTWQEPLGAEVALEMVPIPAGEFLMGSPEDEPGGRNGERPKHLVRLVPFSLARTPITQAQWRQVASWQPLPAERWGKELNPDASYFQNRQGNDKSDIRLFETEANTDNRPVERVSWLDAMEFCSRLSQRTGRSYALPSEAQWEYACRAGTTTPFHFGDTISSDLANYVGKYAYADGPKGIYREQSTPVGMFPANAWGLHDMHGNVWEWCLDEWHENYYGSPTDGSAWVDYGEGEKSNELGKIRLLRGGSWVSSPANCRSAFRDNYLPDGRGVSIGFRVCCLPQD